MARLHGDRFLILVARASAAVWEVTRSSTGVIVNLAKSMAFVNHYSFHHGPTVEHVTIKMSGHPARLVRRSSSMGTSTWLPRRRPGLGSLNKGNCFTAVADPAGLARVVDTMSQEATVGRLSHLRPVDLFGLSVFA